MSDQTINETGDAPEGGVPAENGSEQSAEHDQVVATQDDDRMDRLMADPPPVTSGGFEYTPSWSAIVAALLSAKQQFATPAKNGVVRDKHKNPMYSYALLSDIRESVDGPLTAAGVWVSHGVTYGERDMEVTSRLWHPPSGEWMQVSVRMPVGADPQGRGSLITYGTRYSLLAVLGITPAEDDDDGQAGAASLSRQQGGGQNRQQQNRQQPNGQQQGNVGRQQNGGSSNGSGQQQQPPSAKDRLAVRLKGLGVTKETIDKVVTWLQGVPESTLTWGQVTNDLAEVLSENVDVALKHGAPEGQAFGAHAVVMHDGERGGQTASQPVPGEFGGGGQSHQAGSSHQENQTQHHNQGN